ncbi:MAG TPA: glycosyltransferase family 2 protein [Luteibacter sp.]|jgi:glycosyltransferase involved in cell wall biosynthesis|uniref:glycosyltransferase family 2 protein n=1 Tax=Luteibacter sp. TaxID=1886636 RepID=UPI002F40EBF1
MLGPAGPRDTAERRFAPCAVVPIYNHGRTIEATANALAAHGLPVLIVDDGSHEDTRRILDSLVAGRDDLCLIRLARNGGKGAALSAGFRAAHEAGYTHVLQIDADGQHDTADVPRFLAEAEAAPDAMVCGSPIYDASIPKGRLYGRYLTHACVWLETLSFDIQDSMLGYRLYPLGATHEEMSRKPFPPRMDFDTEIAVRLYWRGVPVRNVATRVIYPENGLSHFRMWRDNARITAMHTRLLLGMLPRAPRLLLRKLTRKPD